MNTTQLEHLETTIRALSLADQLWLMEHMVRRMRNQAIYTYTERSQQLAAMAADPQIQEELRAIEAEFAGTGSDGLNAKA